MIPKILLFIATLISGCPAVQLGASCDVSCPGFDFGTYATQTPTPTTISSTVNVTCQALVSLLVSYSVSFSSGNGIYAQRKMNNGIYSLNYNLYTNSSLATLLGDGTGATQKLNGIMLLSVIGTTFLSTNTHTIYASIPSNQSIPSGVYSDIITLTVEF